MALPAPYFICVANKLLSFESPVKDVLRLNFKLE